MTLDEAIQIVARETVARAFYDLEDGGWSGFPEIGENDWNRVCAAMVDLVDAPMGAEFREAYALLAARADKEETQVHKP